MKTKFKDEFDKFDIDFDIDEITVVKDLGIDPETIKCKAMQQIRASKTKRNRKRLSIWLVAAAVSAAVVGTTVIATTGLLHPDFTPIYTGDVSVLEVVGTNEFNFSSDNNSLNAEFLGMVFTEKNLVASVALIKALLNGFHSYVSRSTDTTRPFLTLPYFVVRSTYIAASLGGENIPPDI